MKSDVFLPEVMQRLADEAEFALSGVAPLPSPCQAICVMDKTSGWCTGCLRNLDEIAAWGCLGDEARKHIWQQVQGRAHRLLPPV